jgi:hypothetical protein
MWARIGPASGIVGWVVSLVGYSIHGYPKTGASAQELARWASTADPNRFAIAVEIEAIGILIIIVFYTWLCDLIRRKGDLGWLAIFAFAMVVVWGAAGIFGNAVLVALLDADRSGVDTQILVATNDVSDELLKATYLFFGLAMVAIAVAAYRGKALPNWLTWPGLVIGVGLAVPATVNFAGLAVLLWAFAVSGLFLLRRRKAAT